MIFMPTGSDAGSLDPELRLNARSGESGGVFY
jgi:hypothetical protein